MSCDTEYEAVASPITEEVFFNDSLKENFLTPILKYVLFRSYKQNYYFFGNKIFLTVPLLGEIRFFSLSLRLRRIEFPIDSD